jgi:hypothetical protein
MTTSIDIPPIYDYLTKDEYGNNKDKMSNIWCDYWANFYQTIVAYITAFGIIPPNLTQDEINSIQQPQTGQMLYNTTIDAPQIYTSTGWKTFTLF